MRLRDDMLATAVDYVYRLGLSVIPMCPEAKKPLIKWKEFQERRPTFSEIAGWPECNLAIVTGAISGIAVIDCESRADAEWFYLNRSKAHTIVKTRRGFHLYFRHPGQTVRNGVRIENRYDVRGDGGYVLAPPSSHADGEYEWVFPFDRESLMPFEPSWRPETTHGSEQADRAIRDGAAYIATIRAVSGQGGHNATYRAACALRAAGLSESEALLAMLAWNQTNADPPWSERDLLHKIQDAYR